MWVDSHAHIDTFCEAGEWDEIRQRMAEHGVTDVVAIGGTAAANQRAAEVAARDPHVHAVVGYDRDEAGKAPDLEQLSRWVGQPGVVGIGETGLDYYYSAESAMEQCELLEQMLDIAVRAGLPVVIHTRDAEDDTVRLLRAYVERWSGSGGVPGVIHCFTGDAAFAQIVLDLGFMVSFSGIVTFKKADELRAALRVVPDDRLLIETDAPYLAPVPMRGKRNEPAYVRYVGEGIAAFLDRSVEDIAHQTAVNARRLFGF